MYKQTCSIFNNNIEYKIHNEMQATHYIIDNIINIKHLFLPNNLKVYIKTFNIISCITFNKY